MPTYTLTRGKHARRENGTLRVYKPGDTISLTGTTALNLGDQVVPATRAAAIALVDADPRYAKPARKKRTTKPADLVVDEQHGEVVADG